MFHRAETLKGVFYMWAEWMENYDLTVTKEDLEKYEENKKKSE